MSDMASNAHFDVAIIGAGPAGMLLGHLLQQQGYRALILEQHTRHHVAQRVRAGVLEQGTVDLMQRLGLHRRLQSEGLQHHGVNLVSGGQNLHIDFSVCSAAVTVYGQQEVMHDLYTAASEVEIDLRFAAQDVALDLTSPDHVELNWRQAGTSYQAQATFVAGCDGFHGICRKSIPTNAYQTYEHTFPFAWLGILADVPPANEELIYAQHQNGFSLASMRSPTRSRYYLQCSNDTDVRDWSDTRIWDELSTRLQPWSQQITAGPSIEKAVAPLRSFVMSTLRYRRLFLAGDAGHIVPPTGAKGLNLAAADVALLAQAFDTYFTQGDEAPLEQYSDAALQRVWQVQRFSVWLTHMTHVEPDADPFKQALKRAEFDHLASSPAQQKSFAEHYTGVMPAGRVL